MLKEIYYAKILPIKIFKLTVYIRYIYSKFNILRKSLCFYWIKII